MELSQSDMNQHSLAETRGSNQIIPLPLAPSELDNKTQWEFEQDILYLHNSLEEVNSALCGLLETKLSEIWGDEWGSQ